MDDAALRDLIEAGRDLWTAGLVTSHGGNLSVRHGGGAIITVTGAMLGRLTPERLVEVDSHGRPQGVHPGQPSSDLAIHLAIYRALPDAGAVVHAHPVHGIALSFEWDVIRPMNLEGRLFIERVPVLDVEWEESAAPVAEALATYPIVLVRGHGAYARGADVWDALRVTSALEEAAQILHLTGKG
jgi:L-fuculose-phosphate aldolase